MGAIRICAALVNSQRINGTWLLIGFSFPPVCCETQAYRQWEKSRSKSELQNDASEETSSLNTWLWKRMVKGNNIYTENRR